MHTSFSFYENDVCIRFTQEIRAKAFAPAFPANLFHCLFRRGGDGNGSADHRVVAHADQAHHLDVRRHGGRTGELSVGVHTAHSIGHTVRRRTGSHIVRVKRTARAAARSHGEISLAVLDAPLLVGAGNGMLESGRVSGVTGDGNTDVLELQHLSYFFLCTHRFKNGCTHYVMF